MSTTPSADTPSFGGSAILRESPPFSFSHTGPGGADLSLSELHISNLSQASPTVKPFSLLSQRGHEEPPSDKGHNIFTDTNDRGADGGELTAPDNLSANVARKERLQHDLFVLKKLNASFTAYCSALTDTMSSTECVAVQLERTDQLLEQYINLLQHTEENAKLIFDQTWEGGGADQIELERIRVEAENQARRAREEEERAAQLALQRQVKEEEERKTAEEKERKEKDKRGSLAVRGVRGVRGTKIRGLGGPSSVRGSATSQIKRSASSTSARGRKN